MDALKVPSHAIRNKTRTWAEPSCRLGEWQWLEPVAKASCAQSRACTSVNSALALRVVSTHLKGILVCRRWSLLEAAYLQKLQHHLAYGSRS